MKKIGLNEELEGEREAEESASGVPELSMSRRGFLKKFSTLLASPAIDKAEITQFLSQDSVSSDSIETTLHNLKILLETRILAPLEAQKQTALNISQLSYSAVSSTGIQHAECLLRNMKPSLVPRGAISIFYSNHSLKGKDFDYGLKPNHDTFMQIKDTDAFAELAQPIINKAKKYYPEYFDSKMDVSFLRQELESSYAKSFKELTRYFCDVRGLSDEISEQLELRKQEILTENPQEQLPEGTIVTKKYPTGDKPEGYNLVIPQGDGESLSEWAGRTEEVAASLVDVFGEKELQIPHESFKGGRIVALPQHSDAWAFFERLEERLSAPRVDAQSEPEQAPAPQGETLEI